MNYDKVFSKIKTALDRDGLVWRRPWVGKKAIPTRFTGEHYRGINHFLLTCESLVTGYTQPEWLTFKQIQKLQGTVKKGEKGTHIVFWSTHEKESDDGETERYGFYRSYVVFNLEQTTGLEQRYIDFKKFNHHDITSCEQFLVKTKAKFIHQGYQASYNPTLDVITLPEKQCFTSIDGYYSTAFHELGHWTGHESRLARNIKNRFRTTEYALEELVAELTSALACAHFGLDNSQQEDQPAAYIKMWSRLLTDNPRAFLTACSEAQKAFDYLQAV